MKSKITLMRNASKKYSQILGALINPRGYSIYSKEFYLYHRLSFSQEGEDLVLSRIFDGQERGFYVDVGAHHPQRFSNTYLFYLKGWRGINIDAMPGSMEPFEKIRPRDLNLEMAISDREEVLTYYEFDEPALNGFSAELSKEYEEISNHRIIATKEIKTRTLANVLENYLEFGSAIDFLSVDAEGLDYEVLKSNDWSRFRPKAIVAEELTREDTSREPRVSDFLVANDYCFYSKLMNSFIFLDNNFLKIRSSKNDF